MTYPVDSTHSLLQAKRLQGWRLMEKRLLEKRDS